MVNQGSAIRLAAAALIVGVALVALWQTGSIFNTDREDALTTGSGEALLLRPADASVSTPDANGRQVGLKEGNLAPDFEFSAFDGRRLRLSDFRGHAVFLNFWATWCSPCRAELPDMETVRRQYAADGLVIIGVNNGESFERANRFIRQLGIELDVLAYDPNQDIVRRYGVFGMPTSYFIDRDGAITRVQTGQMSLRIMQSAVQEAIAGHTSQ